MSHRGVYALVFVCVVLATGSCRRHQPSDRDRAIARERWPFHELEIREAHNDPFPGALPENDKYGTFFVADQPFLDTEQIDRLECERGTVWVALRDHAARDFAEHTGRLAMTRGRMALYVDGKLQSAAWVMAPVRGGRFSLAGTPCPIEAKRATNGT
jgi:hypothetical protein